MSRAVSYWEWRSLMGGALTKPGIPGFPELEPAQELLLEALGKLDVTGLTAAVDISARGGAVALACRAAGLRTQASDASAAALLALERLGMTDDGSSAELVCCILSAERGNARVHAELLQAWRRCQPNGTVLLAGDKDKGFERYLKTAVQWFGSGEVVARARGWRVAQLQKTRLEALSEQPPMQFLVSARGQTLRCVAQAGTFSSGKLDAASALLLEHVPQVAGQRVLDIGAGYGALGGFLALEGAKLTMLEVDAWSAQSARDTLVLNGLNATVLHSDVDASLPPASRFDVVVMNPPFHVGRDLKLDAALEFINAAERHTLPGSQVWLVANHFLPYESHLARLGTLRQVALERGFKLLLVTRH